MTAETWSLIASVVSVLLSAGTIALSVVFFLEGHKSNLLAQSTLTEVKVLVGTVQQQAFAMLKETIQRISQPTLVTSSQPTALDKLPVAIPGEIELDPRRVQMEEDMKALNELYSRLSSVQTQIVSPAGFIFQTLGMAPLLETELRRIADLIALKRAQMQYSLLDLYLCVTIGPSFRHFSQNPQVPQGVFESVLFAI